MSYVKVDRSHLNPDARRWTSNFSEETLPFNDVRV
jgi:hypothetical protein